MILCLSTFILPTLRSLHISSDDHDLSLPATFSILALVNKSCPRLENLSTGHPVCDVERATSLYPVFSSLISSELKAMHYLRFLLVHFNLMNPSTLLALAKLPQLEKLSIDNGLDPHEHTTADIKTVFLPDDSFPALRSLTLRTVDVADILSIWGVPSLVKNLTHLHLTDTYSDDWARSLFGEVTRILPLICIGSPHLQEITIHSQVPMHDPASVDTFDSSWSYMAQLPLRRVELLNFQCDSKFIELISHAWLNVAELRLPDKSASFEDLANLARLPKLEILVIDSFRDFNDPIRHAGRQTLQVEAPLHTIELRAGLTDELRSGIMGKIAQSVPISLHKPKATIFLGIPQVSAGALA